MATPGHRRGGLRTPSFIHFYKDVKGVAYEPFSRFCKKRIVEGVGVPLQQCSRTISIMNGVC